MMGLCERNRLFLPTEEMFPTPNFVNYRQIVKQIREDVKKAQLGDNEIEQ